MLNMIMCDVNELAQIETTKQYMLDIKKSNQYCKSYSESNVCLKNTVVHWVTADMRVK